MPRQYELLSLFGPGSIRTWIVQSAAGEMPETVATCVLLLRQSNAAEDVVAPATVKGSPGCPSRYRPCVSRRRIFRGQARM